MHPIRKLAALAIVTLLAGSAEAQMKTPATQPTSRPDPFLTGEFRWKAGAPRIAPASRPSDPCHAIKDPSVVRHDGRWHVFCTIRSQKRTHQIEHLSFEDWSRADKAERQVLKISGGYFCAPQVFYFRPHKKWYMVYQASDESWEPKYQPAYSTTERIDDPASWTPPKPLGAQQGPAKAWLDFWVICDDAKAHLFFTSLDGRMWRCETSLDRFPGGWGEPVVALQGDVFEASHTYRLKGMDKYLTIIEAEDRSHGNRRYFKAYVADRLDGPWQPLAATQERPFASPVNVQETAGHWTDSFSHGELLRAGFDERLEVDPADLRMLFQGVTDEARQGKAYGQIPWRLGILEPAQ